MATIDQTSPPSAIRNRPEDYVFMTITDNLGRTASGAPMFRQTTYCISLSDCGGTGDLADAAFIERPGCGARGTYYLADADERTRIMAHRAEHFRTMARHDQAMTRDLGEDVR